MRNFYFRRKKALWGILLILCLTGCTREQTNVPEPTEPTESETSKDSGYGLPVEESVLQEADGDCQRLAASLKAAVPEIGSTASEDGAASEEIEKRMQEFLAKKGYPVRGIDSYEKLENYEKMEIFLEKAQAGEPGKIAVYDLRRDLGFSRIEFSFDGTKMYNLYTNADWNEDWSSVTTATSRDRIKSWNYTKKGVFFYELCVPEYPEVTEVVSGTVMMRVRPVNEKYEELAEKYLLSIGYQGNNLLCSEWDEEHMEGLDFNGLFEYFHIQKYGRWFDEERYFDGIPKEEFEELMTEYLPVTGEFLEEHAHYDESEGVYLWSRLGCSNYSPNSFGTSVPEITDVVEQEDKTVLLIIDAVCEMEGTDQIFSHELRVRLGEDGEIQYLGNHILKPGLENVPEYQYRFPEE